MKWYDLPLVRYARMYQHRWYMVVLCVLMALVVSVLQMPIPIIFGHFVDVSIPRHDYRQIIVLCLAAFGLYLLQFGLSMAQRYLTLITTKAVIFKLRARVCTKLQELCLGYYDNTSVGKLHARAMIDTEQVDVASNAIITQILISLATFVIALVVLLSRNVLLTVVLLSVAPISFISVRIFRKRLRESHRAFRDGREHLSSGIHELLSSIRLIKSFGMEPHEEEKIRQSIQEYLKSGIRMTLFSSFFGSMIGTFANLSTIAVWMVGAILVTQGKLTLGNVLVFTGFQGFLLGPINQLANLTETLMSGHTALTKVFELLDEDNVELSNIGFESMAPIRGEVTFENVDFEYSDGTCALQGVSFATQPSRQIALVGESGAGKSTLIHLILGLYLPTAGKVLIDGRDITEMNLRNVRRQMGIVSQETILVNGTVRDNIRYGTPEASDEDVIAAAKVANAHEFISKLADGYEAQIGEDGVRLSGGQRQRLAIARAVLRNPCILILDEATSALDSESEYLVQQALERLSAGRTTFVIAHRLSTILNSDEIFAMKQGRVVERGTHQELLVKHGEYARLYHTQFQRALQLNAALTQQLESQPSRPIA